MHATISSAQALGISGGGGKSVAEVVEMAQEIQALKKKVEKLKAKQKSQVVLLQHRAVPFFFFDLLFVLQDQKVAELQVWEESVPMLRSMLEEAMEHKAQLQAEKEDCTRLRKGMALTWVPDAAVHKCLNCEVAFGLRKWKNHCRCCSASCPLSAFFRSAPPLLIPSSRRYCGRVFCWDCTSRKLEIRCVKLLRGLRFCSLVLC
jgi:hypothetical protein